MVHRDHVHLIERGVQGAGQVWADLGAGRGAFTLALAELLGTGEIHGVDRDRHALRELMRKMSRGFPAVRLVCHEADFTRSMELPPLDGIVMANSLHFVQHKTGLLSQVRSYLKPTGRLILVEYNTDRGNRWVPYPLTYQTWTRQAAASGFVRTRLLATHPSSFLGEFYAAQSDVQ